MLMARRYARLLARAPAMHACSRPPPRSCPRRQLNFLQRKIYVYELWTGLYMLDPWEKGFFNTMVAMGATASCYVLLGWVTGA